MSGQDLTLQQARFLCLEYWIWANKRDAVVRDAVDAGLSKNEIHKLTGIARTTIDAIVARARDTVESPAASNPRFTAAGSGPGSVPTPLEPGPPEPWDGVLR